MPDWEASLRASVMQYGVERSGGDAACWWVHEPVDPVEQEGCGESPGRVRAEDLSHLSCDTAGSEEAVSGAVLVVILSYLLVGALVVLLLRFVGRPDRVLTPMVLFIGIEVLAVWPPLIPTRESVLARVGLVPAVLAAVGLLAMVVTYVLFGGSRANGTGWRGDERVPGPQVRRSMTIGLAVLVGVLVAMGFVTFGGLPPLLSGGFSSLLDPLGHADQAALIRETRLSLTKGHTLLGEAYAGQGIINAVTEAGWRIAVITAVLCWTWSRTKRSLQVLLVVALLAFVFLGSAGPRSPLLLCVVAGLAALAIRYRMRVKHLMGAGLVALGLTLLIMPLSKGATGGETATQRFSATVERVTNGNGQNNAQIVHLITIGSLEPEGGRLFVERLQAMIPGVSAGDPFALRLTRLAYGGTSRTTGYSTPTQYGLLYADGGAPGVLIGYVVSGAVLALGWRRIVRLRSPLGAIVAVEGAIQLGYISVWGIHGVLSTAPVAALALLIASGPRGWSSVAASFGKPRMKEQRTS